MFGLLGKTLKHSFSRKIHQSLGLSYQLLETDNLEQFFLESNFTGLNITIPYKTDVIDFCDKVDPLVRRTNSCNTIVKRDGILYAYNTDYFGFIEAVIHHQIPIVDEHIAIIGNGATARTVQCAFEDLGSKKITIYARNPKKNECSLTDLTEDKNTTILVNTTPVGMYPNIKDKHLFDLDAFPNLKGVIDVVYNPLQTTLLLQAKDKGLLYMNGLYMLVAQAVKSNEYFQDKTIPKKQITTLYRTLNKAQSNIVFIGMPKSGKSLYSRIYADKHNRKIYDIDTLFEDRFDTTIKEYFERFGEEEFRKEEAKLIEEVSVYSGVVISTGGGAILRKPNVDALRKNGVIILIDVSLALLEKTGVSNHRPLLNTTDALAKLYKNRHQTYLKSADLVLEKTSLHTTTNLQALEVMLYEYFGA